MPEFSFTPTEISRFRDPRQRKSLLLIRDESFRTNMVETLEELNRDESLRADFVRDPAGTVVRGFLPDHLHDMADLEISDANKFVMSALSNEGFREWMDEYQRTLIEEHGAQGDPVRSLVTQQNRILRDLAKALLDHGDQRLALNLLEAASSSGRITPRWVRTPPGVRPPDPFPFPVPGEGPELPGRHPGRPDPDPGPEFGIVAVAVAVAVAVVVVIAVVAVAADSDDQVVNVNFENIGGPQFRALADQMVAHATTVAETGMLDDPDAILE